MSDAVTPTPITAKLGAAEAWLSQQNAITVILCGVLGGLGWFGYYALNTAVPAHIELIGAKHKELQGVYLENQKVSQDRFDKALDRILNSAEQDRKSAEEDRKLWRETLREATKKE